MEILKKITARKIFKMIAALLCAWVVCQLCLETLNHRSIVGDIWVFFLMDCLPERMADWLGARYFYVISLMAAVLFAPVFAWLDGRKFALAIGLRSDGSKVHIHFSFRRSTLVLVACALSMSICKGIITMIFPFVWAIALRDLSFCWLSTFAGIMLLEDLFTVKKPISSVDRLVNGERQIIGQMAATIETNRVS